MKPSNSERQIHFIDFDRENLPDQLQDLVNYIISNKTLELNIVLLYFFVEVEMVMGIFISQPLINSIYNEKYYFCWKIKEAKESPLKSIMTSAWVSSYICLRSYCG